MSRISPFFIMELVKAVPLTEVSRLIFRAARTLIVCWRFYEPPLNTSDQAKTHWISDLNNITLSRGEGRLLQEPSTDTPGQS